MAFHLLHFIGKLIVFSCLMLFLLECKKHELIDNMKKSLKLITLLGSLSFLNIVASGVANAAGDAAAGKAKAAVCAACHGANGISMIPNYPNLAGQKELYLVDAIKAYKSGVRKNPIMAPMVASLSDDDIANLAAYFSSLPAGG